MALKKSEWAGLGLRFGELLQRIDEKSLSAQLGGSYINHARRYWEQVVDEVIGTDPERFRWSHWIGDFEDVYQEALAEERQEAIDSLVDNNTREELNVLAREKGVVRPHKLEDKEAVATAIVDFEED